MLKGNKGEWSEIYAFCYLLSQGILRAADKDIGKVKKMLTADILSLSKMEVLCVITSITVLILNNICMIILVLTVRVLHVMNTLRYTMKTMFIK